MTPPDKPRDLLALKRRLQQKSVRAFRCKISRDGEPVSERTFTDEVVKVGTLPSSGLVLDDESVARMHAVFERTGNVWRVIDLGSAAGVILDGERVNKGAELPPTGLLRIGSFDIDYTLGTGSVADLIEDEARERLAAESRDHHKTWMNNLMAEMGRVAPRSHRSASFIQKGWHVFDDKKKRKILRDMVSTIRETRAEVKRFEERSAAAMLAFGAEGLEAIYDASPQEALAKAHEYLQGMANAKHSIELLRGMNLIEGIEEATKVAAEVDADALQSLVYFKKGHENLLERLETTLAAGTTILLACLSRAGGAELSDEDRAKMRTQWDAINETKTG